MQWLTLDHLSHIEEVIIEKDQIQMIRSKKCCRMLNDVPLSEYHVAKRVGPSLPPISIDSIQKAFFNYLVKPKEA